LGLPSRSPGGWQGDGTPILKMQVNEFYQNLNEFGRIVPLQRFQKGTQPSPHLDFSQVIFL